MPRRSDSPTSSALPAGAPNGEALAYVVRPPRLVDGKRPWELGASRASLRARYRC
jgi:hypothetical protein